MAEKPMFPPGQDMSNVSLTDVLEAKKRAKETKAFDEIDKTPAKPASAASAPKKMAKGGSASSRADGIAQRGKTRGTFIMCGGGMTGK
jgi:hypothetical protein